MTRKLKSGTSPFGLYNSIEWKWLYISGSSWKEEIPEIPADNAVQAVICANMSFDLIITNVVNDTGQFCDSQLEEFDWQARSTAARHNIQG